MEWLYRKSRPGAVQYHFIDIADHRSYPPGSPYDPWSFLTEETAPKGMNRLRKSEFLRAIGEVGLDVVAIRAQEGNIPDATQRNFLPRWRQMSEDDQRTIKLNVTLRRPA
jgi:hypothetical protein